VAPAGPGLGAYPDYNSGNNPHCQVKRGKYVNLKNLISFQLSLFSQSFTYRLSFFPPLFKLMSRSWPVMETLKHTPRKKRFNQNFSEPLETRPSPGENRKQTRKNDMIKTFHITGLLVPTTVVSSSVPISMEDSCEKTD
jgi:hypothetical protein